jgi:uncharacterized protein (DUF2342 family)
VPSSAAATTLASLVGAAGFGDVEPTGVAVERHGIVRFFESDPFIKHFEATHMRYFGTNPPAV